MNQAILGHTLAEVFRTPDRFVGQTLMVGELRLNWCSSSGGKFPEHYSYSYNVEEPSSRIDSTKRRVGAGNFSFYSYGKGNVGPATVQNFKRYLANRVQITFTVHAFWDEEHEGTFYSGFVHRIEWLDSEGAVVLGVP